MYSLKTVIFHSYWVGRLSRPILCKVDSKWCALWEIHDKLKFLAMLISHVFLFDMVCAVPSSFQLQGPWFESIGLAEVDRNSVYDGTRNQMGCILIIAKAACANKPWFSAMLRANPACWSETMFYGVPIVFCIWHVQVWWRKWWHLLSVRTVSCKSSMLKWYRVLRCAHCVFAFDMCRFGGESNDIYSACTLFRANPVCRAGAVFGGVPMVFCYSWVDFTQVGRLHAECVCPCGGLTSRGLGWINLGAKYVSIPDGMNCKSDESWTSGFN